MVGGDSTADAGLDGTVQALTPVADPELPPSPAPYGEAGRGSESDVLDDPYTNG